MSFFHQEHALPKDNCPALKLTCRVTCHLAVMMGTAEDPKPKISGLGEPGRCGKAGCEQAGRCVLAGLEFLPVPKKVGNLWSTSLRSPDHHALLSTARYMCSSLFTAFDGICG